MDFLQLPRDIHIAICQRLATRDFFVVRCVNKYLYSLTHLLVVLREVHRNSSIPLPALDSSKTSKELDEELQNALRLHIRLSTPSPVSRSQDIILIPTANIWEETINIIPGGDYVLICGRTGFKLIHAKTHDTWMMSTDTQQFQNVPNAFCIDNARVPTIYIAYRTGRTSSGFETNCRVKCQPLSERPTAPIDLMDISLPSEISAMHANGRFLTLGCIAGEAFLTDLRTKEIHVVEPASRVPIIDLRIQPPYILFLHADLTLSIRVIPLPPFGGDASDFTVIPLEPTGSIGSSFFSVPPTKGHAYNDLIHIISYDSESLDLTACSIRHIPSSTSSSRYSVAFEKTDWVSSRFGHELFHNDHEDDSSHPKEPYNPIILSLGRGISSRMVSHLGAANYAQQPLVLSEIIVEHSGEEGGEETKLVHKKLRYHDEQLAEDLERQDISVAAFDEVSGRIFLTFNTDQYRLSILQF